MSSYSQSGLTGMDPATFTMLQQIARSAAQSRVVKGAYGQAATEAQCLMKLIYGHDLGIPASAALTGIQIYDGEMEIGARLLAALVQRHPIYGFDVKKLNDQGCTLVFKEHGLPVRDVTYDSEQAARAGLLTSDWYTRHPEAMFFARAVSTLVARHCPDVTHGVAVYVEGEIQASLANRPAARNGAPASSGPAEPRVSADEIAAIKQAAQNAGVSDGQLYNVIGVVAGGRGGVDAEQAAARLAQVWERMGQRYCTPVLDALARPEVVAAAQTAAPAGASRAAPQDAHTNANGTANAYGNERGNGGEPLASPGDVRRLRAVAAELQMPDALLRNVIAEVCGDEPIEDRGCAAEQLPAALAVLPLRFVQPVLSRLRPDATAPPAASDIPSTLTVDADPERSEQPGAAGATVTVAFSQLEPRGSDETAGEGAGQEAA